GFWVPGRSERIVAAGYHALGLRGDRNRNAVLGSDHFADHFPIKAQTTELIALEQRIDHRRMLVDNGWITFIIQRRMGFQIDLAATHAELVRLIQNTHRSTDRHHARQLQNIVIEHAEAAMADAHTDTELLVRTMNQVTGERQRELVRTERVVGARWYDSGQDIPLGGVLFTNRLGWIPGRVRRLHRHPANAQWRAPAFSTDTQRECMHHVLPFREVVQTILGQVDHDALARARRQHVTRRQDDFAALTRQPGVDARVGCDHFQIAEIVCRTQIGEGVLVLGLDHLYLADHVLTWRRQWKFESLYRGTGAQCDQRQATVDRRKARQHPGVPWRVE